MANGITLSPNTPVVTLTGHIHGESAVNVFQSNFYIYPPGAQTGQILEAAIFGPGYGSVAGGVTVGGGPYFTVVNEGKILIHSTSAFDSGIVLGYSGTVQNKGSIIAPEGVLIFGDAPAPPEAVVQNTGLIDATIGTAVYVVGHGAITNAGTIIGNYRGIADGFLGNALTVDNSGVIIGGEAGIEIGTGSNGEVDPVTNSGTIIATSFVNQRYGETYAGTGIAISSGTATNTGTIIALQGGGSSGPTRAHCSTPARSSPSTASSQATAAISPIPAPC